MEKKHKMPPVYFSIYSFKLLPYKVSGDFLREVSRKLQLVRVPLPKADRCYIAVTLYKKKKKLKKRSITNF